MRVLVRALVVCGALCSCSDARPLQGEPAHPVSWQEEIAALTSAKCSSCHSGAAPAGGYRTTSYLEALGPYEAPVAEAGEVTSLLLKTIDPAQADAVHQPVSGNYETMRAWVVDGKLSFFRSGIHEGGIMNPHDAAFHSNLVKDAGWNFSTCQGCHGDDLAGGKATVSCQGCHSFQVPKGGVPSCSSCHGSAQSPAPPRDLLGESAVSARGVGAHQAHLFGKVVISARISCDTCHKVPTEVGSDGHIDLAPHAEVLFSGLAKADGAAPAWNGTSCSATYCHGGGNKLSSDANALVRTPAWTKDGSQLFCGSCHGVPPSTPPHGGVVFPNCAGCHPNTVTAGGAIIVSGPPDAPTSKHINGVIDAP
jgi:predicted CxxxxCH...CXXCH cytochrome family protein